MKYKATYPNKKKFFLPMKSFLVSILLMDPNSRGSKTVDFSPLSTNNFCPSCQLFFYQA
uniref:Uncharacterized protein n=1 Tax=Rhizophora mucronata TaxID=61149 RepID=A0A2P2QHG8_RHIMU